MNDPPNQNGRVFEGQLNNTLRQMSRFQYSHYELYCYINQTFKWYMPMEYMLFSLYDITKLVVGPSRKSLMVLLRTGWSCDAFIFNIFKRKLWFAYIFSHRVAHLVFHLPTYSLTCRSNTCTLSYVYVICPCN